MMKTLIWSIVRLFYSTLYSISVKGLENIPKKGRIIIASNHLSNNDPPIILSYIAKIRNDFSVMAKKELFKNPIAGYILEKLGAIKTDRQNINISSIKKALSILNSNGCLMIFPEGTRKKDIELSPKLGIAYLVNKTKSNILPVKISYVKNGNKLGKIIIIFGGIISATNYDLTDEKTQKDFLHHIMKTIYSLQ